MRFPSFFMFVDNDNTIISITLVVIRHALLVVDLLPKEDIRGSSTDSTHQFSWTSVKQGLKSVV